MPYTQWSRVLFVKIPTALNLGPHHLILVSPWTPSPDLFPLFTLFCIFSRAAITAWKKFLFMSVFCWILLFLHFLNNFQKLKNLFIPSRPSNIWSFLLMPGANYTTKPILEPHWFSGASETMGVNMQGVSQSLCRNPAGNSSGHWVTWLNLNYPLSTFNPPNRFWGGGVKSILCRLALKQFPKDW